MRQSRNHYAPRSVSAMGRLTAALRRLADLGAGLMITPSRRTPADITGLVDEATAGYKVPDSFKGYTSQEARVKSDIQVIYNELKK